MSRNFTKFAAALLVVLGMAGSATAQDNDANIIRPITKQGSAAFLFTIQGLGTFGIGAPGISNGPGMLYGAGFKYFMSDDLALRILLALNSGSVKTNGTTSVTSTSMDFGIGVGAEMHFRPLYSTSPYVGAQIGFGSSSTDNGGTGAAIQKTSMSSFGINVLAGFDWFWTRGLAIGAEYGLGFASASGTTTTGTTSTDNPSNTMIGFNNSGNVHLVVYF
jgi:hypothetical protein